MPRGRPQSLGRDASAPCLPLTLGGFAVSQGQGPVPLSVLLPRAVSTFRSAPKLLVLLLCLSLLCLSLLSLRILP